MLALWLVGVVFGLALGIGGAAVWARSSTRTEARQASIPPSSAGRRTLTDVAPIDALETLPDAVLSVDAQGVVLGCTRTAERLIGRGSLAGMAMAELVPQWNDLGAETAERLVSGRGADLGERWTVEARVGKGSAAPVELQRVATDAGWWVVLRDHASHHAALERVMKANANLTEARDKALRESKAKTATLGRVAQSLRTPLTAIAGYGELLGEELSERGLHDLRADVERIQAASDALEAVLQTLLDWSEIEAGRMEVTTAEFELGPLLGEAVAPWTAELEEAGRALTVDAEPDLRVVANKDRVSQIVGHLLRNASQHGAGPVSVKVRRWDQLVALTVRDAGPGLDAEKLAGVFGAGGREGTTGTGVSLHVAQTLATRMGGRLTAESAPGSGTAFTLVVKAADDPSLGPPMLYEDL